MDLNGDANVDIIIGDANGNIHFYTGDGVGNYSKAGGLSLASGGVSSRVRSFLLYPLTPPDVRFRITAVPLSTAI